MRWIAEGHWKTAQASAGAMPVYAASQQEAIAIAERRGLATESIRPEPFGNLQGRIASSFSSPAITADSSHNGSSRSL